MQKISRPQSAWRSPDNLFAGGRHRAAVAEARQSQKEAERLHHAAEITVAEELRAVLARLTAAQQQLTLQRENAAYVEQNRDMVEKEFQTGQASLALLNQAQRDLVEAQAMLALAHVSRCAPPGTRCTPPPPKP